MLPCSGYRVLRKGIKRAVNTSRLYIYQCENYVYIHFLMIGFGGNTDTDIQQ